MSLNREITTATQTPSSAFTNFDEPIALSEENVTKWLGSLLQPALPCKLLQANPWLEDWTLHSCLKTHPGAVAEFTL